MFSEDSSNSECDLRKGIGHGSDMSFNVFLELLRRLPRFRSADGGGVRGADTAGKLSAGAEVHGEQRTLRYEIFDVSTV